MTFEDWLVDHRSARAAAGLERTLKPRQPSGDHIDLAGNDYLGLGHDPRITRAAADAALRWGAGAGASRLVTGTLQLHSDLEERLATFTGQSAALVLPTGYQANLAVVTALTDRDTLIVSDAHVHASLIDACRLARPGGLVVVPHNDPDAVASALRDRALARALVIVESVYSVLGDESPLERLVEAVDRYGGVLVVDEAHALGVAGVGGRGLLSAHGLTQRPDVVSTVTLSKALGAQGGAVLGSSLVVEHLVNVARPFIFATGLAPAATGAAYEALAVLEAEPQLPQRARALAIAMADRLGLPPPAGAVLSVPMPGPAEALEAQAALAANSLWVGCFRPPSVPDGVSRLRLTASAALTDNDALRVLARLTEIRRRR
ncbi:MAG: 8-amino-7-oxononanoate synthase [Nocardioidaceae bacterium]|nr:8-amino-7-oxononanoate synthase [Nocardioidaceae bacterium]